MKILLNGQAAEFEAPMSLAELLVEIGFGEKPVVVELDEQAIFPREYVTVQVVDGARVEIVTLAAGG